MGRELLTELAGEIGLVVGVGIMAEDMERSLGRGRRMVVGRCCTSTFWMMLS